MLGASNLLRPSLAFSFTGLQTRTRRKQLQIPRSQPQRGSRNRLSLNGIIRRIMYFLIGDFQFIIIELLISPGVAITKSDCYYANCLFHEEVNG